MIRKLMASSALLALISAGAVTIAQAQVEPATPVIEENAIAAAPATTETQATEENLVPDEPTLASAYIGRSVFSSEDPESETIGDVNDLIVGEAGAITHAVVGVGGFLGIGEKDVAVPFEELQVVERDGDIRLIYAATREQLEAAPEFDRTAYDPLARFNEEQAALAPAPDAGATGIGLVPPPASTDMAASPEPAIPADAAPADEMTAEAPADAAAPVEEPAADLAANAPADAAAPVEEPAADVAANVPADAAAPVEEPAADLAANVPAGDLVAPAAGEDMAVNAPAETDEALPESTLAGEVAFLSASADQILATDLMGQTVVGAENESIGEISDLVLQEDASARVALIDVGGFLGVGEKTVAIPFDQLQILQGEDGTEQVVVALSRAELEQLPTIEVETPEETAATTPAAPVVDQPADLMAEAPAPAIAPEAPATDEMTTGSIGGSADYTFATQDIAASDLIGSTVYGSDDASIGEVSDVVFDKAGDIDAVVIDVGGFLGMGEKPVAFEFDGINVREDESGTLMVEVNATNEELDAAPAFEAPEETTAQ